MFPVGDDDSSIRTLPVVTYGIIALNVLIFFAELNGGDSFVRRWAFIPARFGQDPAGEASTVFSAMFMHGGWMHLAGNMLYMWVFGNNVEDRLGSVRFLIFYLLAGIGATFAQYLVNPGSSVPNVGASGAIAGVLGAYLLMFPHSRVNVAIGVTVVPMPALIVIGFWIVLQLVSGVGAIAYTDETADTGGVAYMAHVGGFFAGLILVVLLRGRTPTREA